MFYLVIINKSFIAFKALIYTFFKVLIFITKFCYFSLHVYLIIQAKYKGQI